MRTTPALVFMNPGPPVVYFCVYKHDYMYDSTEPMADSTTIRVDRDVHAELKAIANEEGLTLTDTLRKLVEQHRRERMFNQSDRAYQRLRENTEAWDELEAERDEIEGTQADGVRNEHA